jgi:hypothetical protein
MKKKILSGIFALALLIAAGYGVSKSMNGNADLSLLALSNVEALAQSEDGDGTGPCYTLQSSSINRVVCYGGYTYITTYSFDCVGGNGSCSGTIGSTGTDCQGNSFDSRETISRNC